MDADRFDRWTRHLADQSTRRAALRLLTGGALGGLLARVGLEEAAAACTKLKTGAVCADDPDCCSGQCSDDRRPKGTEPEEHRCCLPKGKKCKTGLQCCSRLCNRKTGRCKCRGVLVNCSGHDQCCSGRCKDGSCTDPCPDGRMACNGVCCPSGAHCNAGGACVCDGTNEPPCPQGGKDVCCPTGASCESG